MVCLFDSRSKLTFMYCSKSLILPLFPSPSLSLPFFFLSCICSCSQSLSLLLSCFPFPMQILLEETESVVMQFFSLDFADCILVVSLHVTVLFYSQKLKVGFRCFVRLTTAVLESGEITSQVLHTSIMRY